MDPSIFKKYDIRGTAEGDDAQLNADIARKIGQGFGTYLRRFEQQDTAVVGRDNRRSSYTLAQAFIEGLRASGTNVIDIDLVATPIVYWNAVRRGNIGGVVVTGSHLPPEKNGFKFSVGKKNIFGGQLKLMRRLIETGDLRYGSGTLSSDHTSYKGYVSDIAGRIDMARPLKVVVDAGNGTGGLFFRKLLETWKHEVVACMYCEPDGNYPNHPANPQDEANMRDLDAKVVETGADLGIAFDGDSDRMGAVNEKGEMIAADRILALLARDMLKRHPGASVVADVLSSQVLFDAVKQAGGEPVMWASGHSLVKEKMAEIGALLGGEMSGHIFLGEDYYGYDDGFFAAGRLLQLLAATDQPLSALDESLPRLYSTPEYRPHCPDSDKQKVIDGVSETLQDQGEHVTVDGLRIQFEKGWGLLRASNTEPVLSLRFEAETEADALKYRNLFADALGAYPQVGALT